MDLVINPKFKELLPALSEEEYKQLEESILSDGVQESVKVWRNTIIDGHNRVSICENRGLDYPVKDMYFDDENEALEWIYINQLGRRNLTSEQKLDFIGKLYNLRKKKIGEHTGNQYTERLEGGKSYHLPKLEMLRVEKTAEVIAKDFGVSEKTVRTAGKVVEAVEKYPELTLIPTQKDRITIAKNLDALPETAREESRAKLRTHDTVTLTTLAEKPPMREREFASGESPGEKWAKMLLKNQTFLTSINHNGGIDYLWKNWTRYERRAFYQNVCRMEQDFSNLRETMEEIINNETSNEDARQNVA